jgi:hypothetical protein
VSAADLQMAAAGGREALNIVETIELFAKASYCMSIRVLLLHLVCAASRAAVVAMVGVPIFGDLCLGY